MVRYLARACPRSRTFKWKVQQRPRSLILRSLHPRNIMSIWFLEPSNTHKMAPSAQSPRRTNQTSSAPPSSTILTATKVLSIIRIATGAVCLIAPRLTCSLHGYSIPAESALLVRMMGAREAINGGLLLTVEDKESQDGGKRNIKRALWVGIVADAIDICSVTYGFAMGEVGRTTGGILGTAAAGAITLATLILRGL
ncbi:hypothetical protein B0J13DRAFT_577417 [Dactylonectria estremocensis]|uniref:Uncharacterized protein n=1 Tax=Dactylonectria estremocensis TaxID=1079267 RepID=A0A9P9I8U0_9HYPO|nr:hypothetical protein B0J13DRAFT_577417 [Dactylonectria estremocensis]